MPFRRAAALQWAQQPAQVAQLRGLSSLSTLAENHTTDLLQPAAPCEKGALPLTYLPQYPSNGTQPPGQPLSPPFSIVGDRARPCFYSSGRELPQLGSGQFFSGDEPVADQYTWCADEVPTASHLPAPAPPAGGNGGAGLGAFVADGDDPAPGVAAVA